MSTIRNEEAPPERKGVNTSVWWDIKRCPVPEGYDHGMVAQSIEYALKKAGYCGPLTIIAAGNLEDIPGDLLRTYSSTGIVMKHDPYVISSCIEKHDARWDFRFLNEVVDWMLSNPASSSVVFISDPESARYFRLLMEKEILYAYESTPGYPPPNFPWKTLLEDAMIDSAGKTIKKEFTGEPGAIICTACITTCESGTLIEDGDLTTHLMSEKHQLEIFEIDNAFVSLLNFPLEFVYKWADYHQIPRESLSCLRNHPELITEGKTKKTKKTRKTRKTRKMTIMKTGDYNVDNNWYYD